MLSTGRSSNGSAPTLDNALSILIIGGYGTFGGRIVDLLADEPRLTLLVAGRKIAAAQAFCRTRVARATLVPVAFDRGDTLAPLLDMLKPGLVIDASGPFQSYGAAPYRVIEACIAHGVCYLDLADGAQFVAGVGAYDSAARAKGVYVLTGVSSFPVLTAAVVRHLTRDFSRLDSILGGIAPSPFAGVGLNVIRAIAGYAGQPVPLRRNGQAAIGHPLTEHRRVIIAPPGRVPLYSTLFSLVDVPDLRALADLWPEARDIWMGAGPTPEVLHRALSGLAWLVRLRLLPSLAPLAPLMHVATRRLRWGEHRGGMFVEVRGADAAGKAPQRSWHMIAEGDDGPLIPSMAVEALVRRALNGQPPQPGARAAARELELGDYQALFANRAIHSGARDDRPDRRATLYARMLGERLADLPPAVRAMHAVNGTAAASGRASVERGRSPLARLVAAAIGFPRAVADVAVTVRFEAADGIETWTRTFGTQSFVSRQFAGQGRSQHLLCERFGPLTFAMAVVVADGKLSLLQRRWSAFGVPLPLWLGPKAVAFETEQDGKFRFHVEIGHKLTGLIVRYRGWLVAETKTVTSQNP